MPSKKTMKVRRRRMRTLRRLRKKSKKGGYEGQQLAIPSAGFTKIGNPDNSDNLWGKFTAS